MRSKSHNNQIAALAEHSYESFCDLIKAIEALGYDPETAGRFAAIIGDLPISDDAGDTLVMEDGKIIARLRLNWN